MSQRISLSEHKWVNLSERYSIYADFAQVLIHIARALYINDDFGVALDNTIYALDSTTIDLCLSLFPWARFRPFSQTQRSNKTAYTHGFKAK